MTADHDDEVQKIYRQGSAEEPPVVLDRAILEAAVASVTPAPKPRRPWWSRYALPLQLAFSVVLVVMLALIVERNPPDVPTLTDSTEPRQAPASPANEAKAPTSVPKTSTVPARPVERKMEVAPAAGPMPGKGQADSAEKAAAGDLARPAAARLSATTSPSDWLAAIERLAAAGDEVDARAEFAAFRKAYPDYPVHDRLEKMLAP